MDKKISVVLAVYNGEKYIIEQLESIRKQTVKVDELIVKDDGSKDNTCKIVEEYLQSHNLPQWKLMKNPQNQGWKKNFVDGLHYVSGEYIFFCDQDDIWMPEKIEKMVSAMNNNKAIELLVSNYEILHMDHSKSYIEQAKNKQGDTVYPYPFTNKFLHVKYPGCVYCIRRSLVKFYQEYWKEVMPHDAFAWHLATVRGSLYVYNKPLIQYRRHAQTVTGRSISNREKRIQDLAYYREVIAIYNRYLSDYPDTKFNRTYLKRAEKWLANREKVLEEKDVKAMLRSIKYIPYYWSFKTAIMDILV